MSKMTVITSMNWLECWCIQALQMLVIITHLLKIGTQDQADGLNSTILMSENLILKILDRNVLAEIKVLTMWVVGCSMIFHQQMPECLRDAEMPTFYFMKELTQFVLKSRILFNSL